MVLGEQCWIEDCASQFIKTVSPPVFLRDRDINDTVKIKEALWNYTDFLCSILFDCSPPLFGCTLLGSHFPHIPHLLQALKPGHVIKKKPTSAPPSVKWRSSLG